MQIELAVRLGYLQTGESSKIQDRVARVGRMLNGLISSIQPVDDEK